jgi:hypothetical protein
MPLLSRCFVRSALVCLAIGFTLGGLILAAKGGGVDASVWIWLPEHIVILLFGWLVQLSLGVAYWILPRVHLMDRGRQRAAWASLIAFQTGIGLTLLSLLRLWIPPVGGLLPLGLIWLAAAILAFVVHAWPRIHAAIIRAQETLS